MCLANEIKGTASNIKICFYPRANGTAAVFLYLSCGPKLKYITAMFSNVRFMGRRRSNGTAAVNGLAKHYRAMAHLVRHMKSHRRKLWHG
jgi:hypothetical protein